MQDVIEGIAMLLLDGMPNLSSRTPLNRLPKRHPEVVIQSVLVNTANKLMAPPVAIARFFFSAIAGPNGFLDAREANAGDCQWNHEHRHMLRRLTLAVMRHLDGPNETYQLQEIDDFLFAVLITDEELDAELAQSGLKSFVH
jgi:hypothetical protein